MIKTEMSVNDNHTNFSFRKGPANPKDERYLVYYKQHSNDNDENEEKEEEESSESESGSDYEVEDDLKKEHYELSNYERRLAFFLFDPFFSQYAFFSKNRT